MTSPGAADGADPFAPARSRRALVTGASRGIGRAVAAALASEGFSLALVARHEDSLAQVAASLPGGPHDVLAFDVSDGAQWARAAAKIAPEGRIDGVVTAAAVLGPIGPPGSWRPEEFAQTLEVNVGGTLLAVLSALEALKAEGGSIVTFSGGGATAPLPFYDAYAASKAAVVRLTENLARELAPEQIRVNAIAPGFVATEMHSATLAAGPELVGDDYFERTRSIVESGGGDPPELAAELCSFLLSAESVGITGKLLSARWDPWRDREFQDRLRREPELATIRRIDDQFFAAVSDARR